MKHPCLNLDTQGYFQTGNLDITGSFTGRKDHACGLNGHRRMCRAGRSWLTSGIRVPHRVALYSERCFEL
jgi:hypothetical protein